MSLTLLAHCRSLPATRAYYRDVLGFEVRQSAEDTVTVSLHGSSLIFTESDLWKGAGGGSFTVYIAVVDIDDYFETVKDKTEIAWPLQEMAYGSREFAIRDCNGYLIAFQVAVKSEITGVNGPLVVEDRNHADSRFSDVNLENANFQDTDLRTSRFRDVNLSGASFTDDNLSNASIVDSNLQGLTIDGVLLSQLLRNQ